MIAAVMSGDSVRTLSASASLFSGGFSQPLVSDYLRRGGLQKLVHVGTNVFTDRNLLLDEVRFLFKQNNEKVTRSSTPRMVTESAKAMTYDNFVAAE